MSEKPKTVEEEVKPVETVEKTETTEEGPVEAVEKTETAEEGPVEAVEKAETAEEGPVETVEKTETAEEGPVETVEKVETAEEGPVETVKKTETTAVEKIPAAENENKEVKKGKKPVNPIIDSDIMRYKKNKLGGSLALLGLALGCVYFIVLYAQVANNNYYYNWQIAFDVIYNLFFLLFVFLFSEQVKNYNRNQFIVQIIVGLLQIARIFWLPLSGIITEITVGGVNRTVLSIGSFLAMAIALGASGVCIIASAIIGYIRTKKVENFTKQLENGEIDLDKELKEETAGGNANA